MKLSTIILRTFSLLWIFILTGGVAVYWSIERNNQAVRQIQQGQLEITQIALVLKSVLDLETGMRGYLLTGEHAFLEPYTAAQERLPGELSLLKQQLEADQTTGEGRNRALGQVIATEHLIEQWLREAAQPQIAARQQDPALAVALVKTQKGKQIIDTIRQKLAGLSELRARQVQQKQALNQASLSRLQLVTPLGVLLALVTSVLFSSRLAANVSRVFQRLGAATRELASGNLNARAPLSHLYEAQQLAHDFNQMAEALGQAQAGVAERTAVLERKHREISQLTELTDALQSCQSAEEGYRLLGHALPRIFPDLSGALCTLNPSKNLLETRIAWGEAGLDPVGTLREPGDCWALHRGHAYEPGALGLPCPHHEGRTGASLCLPLLAHNEALGTLHLCDPEHPTLPELARAHAHTVAQQLALAIGNLRLRESLRQQSIRDPMTGLFNRRYLEETLERELHRAQRTGSPLSVLAIDIDHFKKFNDTYGHDAGDAVLLAVARSMQEFFRAEDIVCRYGGEEFIVVLLNAPQAATVARADAFRERVGDLRVRHAGQGLGRVTVSIGAASSPDHSAVGDGLIKLADQALYQAKREGRNRVVGSLSSGA